jgi:alkanesulfonate monooxygenase SsuD/methylene tetrahydromethanopterin reductase-like flavin-dependent oxidoreductase (luciferase family)
VDGHHEAAWRRPGHDPAEAQRFSHYLGLAQVAERGKLDSLFLADNLARSDNVRFRSHSPFEPLTLLAALATGTEHLKLIATA